MNAFSQALSVARKDLAIEFRTKESLNSAGAFSIVILVLFSFAFDLSAEGNARDFGRLALALLFVCRRIGF